MYDYGTYDYGNSYEAANTAAAGILAGLGVYMLIISAISIVCVVSLWIIFKKLGRKGWESIIPIYSNIVLLQAVGLPAWYFVLNFIPLANIFVAYKQGVSLAEKFGKSTGFGILCMFFPFICYPILAFGKNKSVANENVQSNYQSQPVQQPVVSSYEPVQMEQPVVSEVQESVAPVQMEQPVVSEVQEPVAPMVTPAQMEQPVVSKVQESVAPVVTPVQMEQPASPEPVVQTAQGERRCPSCGSKLGSDAQVCFMCGTRI